MQITDEIAKKAAVEFLSYRGESPFRVTRRGAELWEDYTEAMRFALTAALPAAPAPAIAPKKDDLNRIAKALQDLWRIVKPRPCPSAHDAIWREYAAEIRRVVLSATPAPGVSADKDEVVFAVKRGDGYEDVHPQLVGDDCFRDGWEWRILAAPDPGVKVRDLVWEEMSERCWDADGMGKLYRVMKRIDGSAKLKNGLYDHGVDYADIDAAKAAAQADYEARIRAALSTEEGAPATETHVDGDNSPRYSMKRMREEIAKAKSYAHREALQDAAGIAYRACVETRNVTLGEKARAAIMAIATTEGKDNG